MAKKKAEPFSGSPPPTDADAAERWKAFCKRLDELTESTEGLRDDIADVVELVQMLVMAMRDAASVTNNPILGLMERVVNHFTEARRDHAKQ